MLRLLRKFCRRKGEVLKGRTRFFVFDVHGSVHIGNEYVQLKDQQCVHVLYSYVFFIPLCF
jgi:hypothetical protein